MIRMLWVTAMVAVFPLTSARAQVVPVPPQPGWKTIRQDLEVTISPDTGRIVVAGTIRVRLEGAESSIGPTLAINGRKNLLSFQQVSAPGADAQLNGIFPQRESVRLAQLRFPSPRRRGEEVEISFVCEGAGESNQFAINEDIAFASWTEAWYPIPTPSPGESLSSVSRAAGRTQFNVPAGWSVVSNGRHVSREASEGGVVDIWETDAAVSRSFAAGPYVIENRKAGDLDVAMYLLSDIPGAGDHVVALANAMEAMEDKWGSYPYPGVAIAEVPQDAGSFGASSEQGFIMVKPHFLNVPGGNLPLFAHEAAHGWWGNTVGTSDPSSLLCSESLAQYGAVIAIEATEGREAATDFLRFSRAGYVGDQCARGYFQILRSGRDIPLAELQSGAEPDHTLADAKGHWVYHMLRRRVGDDVFFATLRGLLERFSGATMNLNDVRNAFQEAAPDAELETFFAQWLERTGAPVLETSWQQASDGAEVTIHQRQTGDPFHLRLDVLLRLANGEEALHHVQLRDREQRFELSASATVVGVQLDPRNRLLLWSPQYGAPTASSGITAPALTPEQIAAYEGDYAVEGRSMIIRVFESEMRLTIKVATGVPTSLWPVDQHRFRSDGGYVTFDVRDGRAVALEFLRDNQTTTRAVRR